MNPHKTITLKKTEVCVGTHDVSDRNLTKGQSLRRQKLLTSGFPFKPCRDCPGFIWQLITQPGTDENQITNPCRERIAREAKPCFAISTHSESDGLTRFHGDAVEPQVETRLFHGRPNQIVSTDRNPAGRDQELETLNRLVDLGAQLFLGIWSVSHLCADASESQDRSEGGRIGIEYLTVLE